MAWRDAWSNGNLGGSYWKALKHFYNFQLDHQNSDLPYSGISYGISKNFFTIRQRDIVYLRCSCNMSSSNLLSPMHNTKSGDFPQFTYTYFLYSFTNTNWLRAKWIDLRICFVSHYLSCQTVLFNKHPPWNWEIYTSTMKLGNPIAEC